ncbi:MAG: LysM peptidoglycan-binding domain-containing protein [Bacteroidota bacterium]
MKFRKIVVALFTACMLFSFSMFAQSSTHTVKKKETLYSLSKKYGITVEELKTWNNLTSNTIKIGQKLKVGDNIPEPGTDLSAYEVAMLGLDKGKMTVDEAAFKLSLINDLQREEAKKERERLTRSETMVESRDPFSEFSPENLVYYQVKPGDDLFSIADSYEVSVDDLKYWNDIQGVQAGDVIIVNNGMPMPNENSATTASTASGFGLSRGQNVQVVEPTWYDPVPVAEVQTQNVGTFRGPSLATFTMNEVKGGEIIYSRNMGRDTDSSPTVGTRGERDFPTYGGTTRGGNVEQALPQPQGPMVVLPGPGTNSIREAGSYTAFTIPGYNHFRFYGAHKILPVGSKVKVDIPNNPGFIEVTIVEQLPPQSPHVIGLSPSAVSLLKSNGAPSQISVMY